MGQNHTVLYREVCSIWKFLFEMFHCSIIVVWRGGVLL